MLGFVYVWNGYSTEGLTVLHELAIIIITKAAVKMSNFYFLQISHHFKERGLFHTTVIEIVGSRSDAVRIEEGAIYLLSQYFGPGKIITIQFQHFLKARSKDLVNVNKICHKV